MNPNPSKSSPYTIPLRSNEIRLFRIFKYGDSSISGELRHFHLDESPKFIATSYVWGDRDDRVPIQLNGHKVDILRTALEFFNEMLAPDHFDQFPPSKTWWWMDCICINQDDPAERSVQVGLMSEIYQRALKTVIWLGEESDDSNVGMGFLKLLAEDWNVVVDSFWPELSHGNKKYWETNVWPEIAKNTDGWRAAENLLTRKWWERVWTLQEFLLSKDAAFFCGSKRISLSQMAYAIHAVWEWHQRRDRGIISRRGYEKGWNRIRMMEWYDHGLRQKEHLPLVAILTYTATSSVTDPRDRLYSLLGLISPLELDIIGRPDYESSASSIYIDFAISFTKKYRTLDLLCIAPEMKENLPPGEAERVLDLPSWVPDWSLRRTQSPPMLCMANQSANPHIGNFRPVHSLKYYREYRASGPLPKQDLRVSFSEDLREITCAGIILDEIDGLGGGQVTGPGDESDNYKMEMVHSTSAVNSRSPECKEEGDNIHISLAVSITEQITRSLTLNCQDPYLGKAAPVRAFTRAFRRICRQSQEGTIQDLSSGELFAPETDAPDSTAEIAEWFLLNKDLCIRGVTLGEAIDFSERDAGKATTGQNPGSAGQAGQPGQRRPDTDREGKRGKRKDLVLAQLSSLLVAPFTSGFSLGGSLSISPHSRTMAKRHAGKAPALAEIERKSKSDHDPEPDPDSGRDQEQEQDRDGDGDGDGDREHELRDATKFATRFRSTTYRRGKRLMVTKNGIVGMAPRLSRKSDVVCVLLGCSIPLVLRAEDEDEEEEEGAVGKGKSRSERRERRERRFTVIGEAYVDGYMNGEAVDEVDRDLRRVEDLRIV